MPPPSRQTEFAQSLFWKAEMLKLVRGILHALGLLVAVSLLSFSLLSMAPGNFFDELRLNPQISPKTVEALKATYGIDRPWPVRYFRWVRSALHGDFGYSFSYNCPVGALLWIRARNTLLLTSLATLLAWMLALPWGTLEALRRGGWIDRLGAAITAFLLAIPDILLGLLLLLAAARTGLLPVGGMTSASAGKTSLLSQSKDLGIHLVLPILGLALGLVPILVRHVRSAMVQVLETPYIQAARGYGIKPFRILYRHALPAALNSLVTLLGFSLGALLSMSLLMEVIMSWPGLGPLLLEALLARDLYVVVAGVLLSSVFLLAGNLIADFLLYLSDPRIRSV
jgi:peptide/nickel transport system permease protein